MKRFSCVVLCGFLVLAGCSKSNQVSEADRQAKLGCALLAQDGYEDPDNKIERYFSAAAGRDSNYYNLSSYFSVVKGSMDGSGSQDGIGQFRIWVANECYAATH